MLSVDGGKQNLFGGLLVVLLVSGKLFRYAIKRVRVLFLYNSGARVSEAAALQIGDLNLRGNQMGDAAQGQEPQDTPLPTLVSYG